MDYAVILTGVLVLLIIFITGLLLVLRPRRRTLAILAKNNCAARDMVARLDTEVPKYTGCNYTDGIFHKINTEAKLFNKMAFVMPCVRNVPSLYITYLGRLHKNPNLRPRHIEQSAIGRFVYLHACMALYAKASDNAIKKQLVKNAIYYFITARVEKEKAQIRGRINKIVFPQLTPTAQPLFNIMRSNNFAKIMSRNSDNDFTIKTGVMAQCMTRQFKQNYTSYRSAIHGTQKFWVRNFVLEVGNVQCYDISLKVKNSDKTGVVNNSKYMFELPLDVAKSFVVVSQTSDSLYVVCRKTKSCRAIYICAPNVGIATNMARRETGLKLQLALNTNAQVFIINEKTKQDAIATISQIKGRQHSARVDRTLVIENKKIQQLIGDMYNGRYISGDGMKKQLGAVRSVVPSVLLPTKVYDIENLDDFSKFRRTLEIHKITSSVGVLHNVVIMYSSQDAYVCSAVSEFTKQEKLSGLTGVGVFIFFVDKMRAKKEVVAYLSKILEESGNNRRILDINAPISNNALVVVSRQSKGNVVSVFANNNSVYNQQATVSVPINVGITGGGFLCTPVMVTKLSGKVKIVNPKTGHGHYLKIPKDAVVYVPSGDVVEKGERMTDKIIISVNMAIKAKDEKVFDITKVSARAVSEKIVA